LPRIVVVVVTTGCDEEEEEDVAAAAAAAAADAAATVVDDDDEESANDGRTALDVDAEEDGLHAPTSDRLEVEKLSKHNNKLASIIIISFVLVICTKIIYALSNDGTVGQPTQEQSDGK
jgi:hypothetical protein